MDPATIGTSPWPHGVIYQKLAIPGGTQFNIERRPDDRPAPLPVQPAPSNSAIMSAGAIASVPLDEGSGREVQPDIIRTVAYLGSYVS